MPQKSKPGTKTPDLVTVKNASLRTGIAQSTIRSWKQRKLISSPAPHRVSVKEIEAYRKKSPARAPRTVQARKKMTAQDFADRSVPRATLKTVYDWKARGKIAGYFEDELSRMNEIRANPKSGATLDERMASMVDETPTFGHSSGSTSSKRARENILLDIKIAKAKGELYEVPRANDVLDRIVATLKDALDRVPIETRQVVRALAEEHALILPDSLLDQLYEEQEKRIRRAIDNAADTLDSLAEAHA